MVSSVYNMEYWRTENTQELWEIFLHQDLLGSLSPFLPLAHTPLGSMQQQLFWGSLTVLGVIRVAVCCGVICSLAGEAHFLVRGHWALAAVHQYGSL